MANGSIGIGKIFGIAIELNWLFILLILFFLYVSPLLGLIWILLFVCVLIHELSHSVTAIRNGVSVSKIILLPIGGASVINDTNIDPAIEFRISIVGPLMSFVLGGIFGIAVLFTPPGILTYIVQYLFLINILLGAFNILPAFPMDGGRVLRSYLERTQGQYAATMQTLKVSKYCMAIIILGTLAFVLIPSSYDFGSKELIFLWDILIVFFLYQGVVAEENAVTIKRDTKGMAVSQATTDNYAIIDYDANVKLLYNLIKDKKEYIILTKNPQGDYELVDLFSRQGLKNAKKVSDISETIPNMQSNMSMIDALVQLEGSPYHVGAVLSGKNLLGIATANHINAFVTLHMMSRTPGKPLNS